jgi:hypothetical protein
MPVVSLGRLETLVDRTDGAGSSSHYLVLEINEMTKMTVKIATTSTRGKGENSGLRNGIPRSECMAQPPTIATLMIIYRVAIRVDPLVGF